MVTTPSTGRRGRQSSGTGTARIQVVPKAFTDPSFLHSLSTRSTATPVSSTSVASSTTWICCDVACSGSELAQPVKAKAALPTKVIPLVSNSGSSAISSCCELSKEAKTPGLLFYDHTTQRNLTQRQSQTATSWPFAGEIPDWAGWMDAHFPRLAR